MRRLVAGLLAALACVMTMAVGTASAQAISGPGRVADGTRTLVTGSVELGPTCPVQQVGQDCTIHGAPATITATSLGRTRTTTADSDGFRLRLRAGTWRITADAGMHCETVRVVVRSGTRPAPIVIACDTGIR